MKSLHQIAHYCSAQLFGKTDLNQNNWEPLIDSRLLNNPDNTIFFAIVTPHNNGHKYIPELISKGVKAFVVEKVPENYQQEEVCFLLVKNTLKALQEIASGIRQTYTHNIIGITGSNGKTIVKEWLVQLLPDDLHICYSPKSYNSQLGVPLSIWPLDNHFDLGIFEAGISTTGEMDALEAMIKPDIGILTHLGPAHNQGFDNPEQKLQEKLKLFANTKCLITQYNAKVFEYYSGNILCYDFNNPKSDLNITSKEIKGKSTYITALFKNEPLAFNIPFIDDASVENACLCALTLLYLDSFKASVFSNLQAVSMRLELKKGIHNCLLVNDSYSNDLHALGVALNFLKQQSIHSNQTVILSDIEESGLPSDLLYANVKRMLKDQGIYRLIAIGPDFKTQTSKFESEFEFKHYNDTNEFIELISVSAFKDESILIKGARKFAFEKIVRKLQQETHGSVLEINLSAALHNLNAIKSRLSPEIKVMAMVKAFAYGSGTYEMAKLICNKVDYLAVAYTDEGVALRNSGINTPIMVMNPEEDSYFQLLDKNLEPVVFSVNQLKSIALYSLEQGNKNVRIHIELDTGMHRLGFMNQDIEDMLQLIQQFPHLQIASVFSHLSASDEAVHDNFTLMQFQQMNDMSEKIEKAIGYSPIKHISNTAAALRFVQNKLNMVRIGIGIYGIDPTGAFKHLLEPVFTFKTTISQIKMISANESIGYSRKSIANHERRIAILSLGYADGLNRALSNGKGSVYISGKLAPITGNICMDMCMVDVTDIICDEGDEVIIFGKERPIEEIAQTLQTIPYEILTSISQRVKRVYVSE